MINLVVKGAIDDKKFLSARINDNNDPKVDETLQRCRDLASLFNHSYQLKHKLCEAMTRLHADSSQSVDPKFLKPRQDVVTRWNSTYLMLKSILVCEGGIRSVINNDAKVCKRFFY